MPSPPPDRARRKLSHQQEMLLLYGPNERWEDAFASVEECHGAWEYHRHHIMTRYRHGHRPWAWWEFEAPPELDYDYDREQSTLFAAGLLGEAEARELLDWWREQFDHAWSPHFFHCDGPERIFDGPVGRRKHYQWADIPPELVRKWSGERRRRDKTIRKLKTTISEPASA
jgi:hypothetical protein